MLYAKKIEKWVWYLLLIGSTFIGFYVLFAPSLKTVVLLTLNHVWFWRKISQHSCLVMAPNSNVQKLKCFFISYLYLSYLSHLIKQTGRLAKYSITPWFSNMGLCPFNLFFFFLLQENEFPLWLCFAHF